MTAPYTDPNWRPDDGGLPERGGAKSVTGGTSIKHPAEVWSHVWASWSSPTAGTSAPSTVTPPPAPVDPDERRHAEIMGGLAGIATALTEVCKSLARLLEQGGGR